MGRAQAAALVFGALLSIAILTSPAQAQDCSLYEYRAIVTRVVDGDTADVDIDLGFRVWLRGERLRLVGVDAPEVRGQERPAGERAKAALAERIEGKEVRICTERDEKGKFGRYLATIYLDGENVNQWLLDQGLAKPYR